MSLEKAAVVDSGNWDVNSYRRVVPGVKHVLTQLESYDVATVSKQSLKLTARRILPDAPLCHASRDAAGNKQVYGDSGTCSPYASSVSVWLTVPSEDTRAL